MTRSRPGKKPPEPDGTGLSSNTLFHFTSSFANVISILENEFRPHLSLERLVMPPLGLEPDDSIVAAIPMICFCDVPLSEAQYHLDVYGNYAVGMTKDWGLRHGIAPVLYAHPNSGITHSAWRTAIRVRRFTRSRKEPEAATLWNEIEQDVDRILYHTKEYSGLLERHGMTARGVRFYDEREWRFVPEVSREWLSDGALSLEEFRNEEYRREINQELWERYVLAFEPSDIRYIIVADEIEIVTMASEIRRIKRKYTDDDKTLLISRLISAVQVKADF